MAKGAFLPTRRLMRNLVFSSGCTRDSPISTVPVLIGSPCPLGVPMGCPPEHWLRLPAFASVPGCVTLLAGSLSHSAFHEVTPSLNSPFEPTELVPSLVRSLAETISYSLQNPRSEKLIV